MHGDAEQIVTLLGTILTRKKSNQGHHREYVVELVLGQWRLIHDGGEPGEDLEDVELEHWAAKGVLTSRNGSPSADLLPLVYNR